MATYTGLSIDTLKTLFIDDYCHKAYCPRILYNIVNCLKILHDITILHGTTYFTLYCPGIMHNIAHWLGILQSILQLCMQVTSLSKSTKCWRTKDQLTHILREKCKENQVACTSFAIFRGPLELFKYSSWFLSCSLNYRYPEYDFKKLE